MQLHDVLVVQQVIAFDGGAVVDGLAPDPGELQVLQVVLVHHAGQVDQLRAATHGERAVEVGMLGRGELGVYADHIHRTVNRVTQGLQAGLLLGRNHVLRKVQRQQLVQQGQAGRGLG